MFPFSELPKSDEDSAEPEADQQPLSEPAHIIDRPKRGTHPGASNRKQGPLFQSQSTSSSEENNLPEPGKESINIKNRTTSADSTVLSGSNKSLNPGQRLRTLEKAGRNPQPDQPPETATSKPADSNPSKAPKLQSIFHLLPNGQMTRRAYWDVGPALSLIINIILLIVVIIMATQINKLRNTVNGMLDGMFNDLVRMDNSVISTTINMTDVPIPLNFNLPVVQKEINVTLTHPVTIQSAHVTITTGGLTINNAPATITLPQGTILPVSLQMDVPVQTTILMNLQVPVNIKLAEANSPDPNVGSLHTAFVDLQDAIGPLYCQYNPQARDYLNDFLCNDQGNYIKRSPASNP